MCLESCSSLCSSQPRPQDTLRIEQIKDEKHTHINTLRTQTYSYLILLSGLWDMLEEYYLLPPAQVRGVAAAAGPGWVVLQPRR